MTNPDHNPAPTTSATTSPVTASPATSASPESARRTHLSEDWLATIVGLTLLALVLAGVLGADVVP
jgi:hypothetical protein